MLCILPPTRPLGRRLLARFLTRRLQTPRRPGDDHVIRGEVVD
jgi:hypothetical protein